ncbi:acetate--CoA ligase family protein [Paraburkholderia agricolaris]|uniref:acetate--CoA ligase family protein n=1 Tax=Paraburkholderia agricolaris TaxID=2152888 RepID=UPI0038B8BD93
MSIQMSHERPAEPLRASTIDVLFSARSIAIVGASSDPSRIGGRPLRYYRESGFTGRIYPINPSRKEVQGYTAYPDLASLPESIDLVIIAVGAELAPQIIVDAAARGARGAIIFSSGFAEMGAQGAALERDMLAVARAHGVRVLGPNCLGLAHAAHRQMATFASFVDTLPLPQGRVAIVSQSGAYGSHLFVLARARGIPIGAWVTTGNEGDVTLADCVMHMVKDDSVDLIGCYAEGVSDGPAFLAALDAARAAGKPVVIMKVGRTASGASAAQSHTASLASDDAVLDAALIQYGAYRVPTTEAFIDLIYALSRRPPTAGRKLGVLTVSGGAGVLMADAASDHALTLSAMPAAIQRHLRERAPFGSPVNPVDITAQALNDMTLVSDHLRAMLEHGGYDSVVGFFMNWAASPVTGPLLRRALADGMRGFENRTVAIAVTAPREIVEEFEASGMLVFEDPTRAIATLAALAIIGERLAVRRPVAGEAESAASLPLTMLDEAQTKALLAEAGIPALLEAVVQTPEAAEAASVRLGLPVALKIVSPDIAHKTELGGVALNLRTGEEVRLAARRMLSSVRERAPEARLSGLSVTPMAGAGIEMIVAARTDPCFGPVMMVGLGGVFVEIFRDVAFRIGALTVAQARDMLAQLKAWPLLQGARGAQPVDVDALAEVIARLSRFAVANQGRFETIEINPLLVRPGDAGPVMLDALIVPAAGVAKEQ